MNNKDIIRDLYKNLLEDIVPLMKIFEDCGLIEVVRKKEDDQNESQ